MFYVGRYWVYPSSDFHHHRNERRTVNALTHKVVKDKLHPDRSTSCRALETVQSIRATRGLKKDAVCRRQDSLALTIVVSCGLQ